MKKYPPYNPPAVEDLRQMIVSKAESNPDGIAFMYTGDDGSVQTVTYARFRADVDAVGTYFHEQGIVEGKHVALLGVNSYEWLATFFALVNGGNVVLPLDARQPVENLIRLLWDGDCAVLAYSKEFEPAIPAFAASLNDSPAADARGFLPLPLTSFSDWVREGEKLIALGDRSFIDCEIDVHDMCALVFTSGTTGKPKGVMLSQDNIAANIYQASQSYVLEGVGLSPLPMHHMFGLIVGHLMVFNYNRPCYIVRNIRNVMKDIQIDHRDVRKAVPYHGKAHRHTDDAGDGEGGPRRKSYGYYLRRSSASGHVCAAVPPVRYQSAERIRHHGMLAGARCQQGRGLL